jgi:hypothetical protein
MEVTALTEMAFEPASAGFFLLAGALSASGGAFEQRDKILTFCTALYVSLRSKKILYALQRAFACYCLFIRRKKPLSAFLSTRIQTFYPYKISLPLCSSVSPC